MRRGTAGRQLNRALRRDRWVRTFGGPATLCPDDIMDPKWILKGLVESSFVVASILMALAVDEWAQNKEYEDLASQSLEIFEREIGSMYLGTTKGARQASDAVAICRCQRNSAGVHLD